MNFLIFFLNIIQTGYKKVTLFIICIVKQKFVYIVYLFQKFFLAQYSNFYRKPQRYFPDQQKGFSAPKDWNIKIIKGLRSYLFFLFAYFLIYFLCNSHLKLGIFLFLQSTKKLAMYICKILSRPTLSFF